MERYLSWKSLNDNKDFQLSKEAISCRLDAILAPDGKVAAYASQTGNATEKNYDIKEKEYLL